MRTRTSFAASLALLGALGCEQAPTEGAPDAFRIRRDASIDAVVPDAGPPPTCPPSGPFGSRVQDVLGNLTVYDCEGTPIELHSLCETDVVWIWELAEWCSPCRRFAAGPYDTIQQRYRERYGERFASLAIITADDELNLPTVAICEVLRARYGIEGPLYFDPSNTLRDLLGGYSNDEHAILTRGMRIAWTMQFGGDFVDARLQATFDELDTGAMPSDAAVSLDAGPLDDVTAP